jgi:SPP1 family predicted phage head-tail adaptor
MANALQGISTYRLRVRYRTGILASDQIEWRGTTMNVRSAVDPNGTREQLLIMADTASVRAES